MDQNEDKMQRDEKHLENTIDAVISRLQELKDQLIGLLFKVEHERETLPWPSVLNSFALISGQFTSISKMLSHEKAPPMRNYTLLPLYLSPDRDEDLFQLTEHRIPAFNHDLVPDYLRTKPEPDIEMKIQQFIHKANSVQPETAQKQSAAFNKVLNHIVDIITKAKEDWDSESRGGIGVTSSMEDTRHLVSVISTGAGLKPTLPPPGMVPSGIRPNVPPPMGPSNPNPGGPPQMGMQMGKMPGPIKTNIKAGSQVHPYR